MQEFIASGRIACRVPPEPKQIQPASLDLRLGATAYRVRASFLPGKNSSVDEKIRDLGMTEIDLRPGAVFEKRCVYIVPLMEEWFLPEEVSGKANPKSTTGRLDLFTRLITDYGTEFERVPQGYRGRLYAEVVPRTFSVRLQEGMSLNQVRFIRGNPPLLQEERTLKELHVESPLSYSPDDSPAESPRLISIDLAGASGAEVVGYKAKNHAPLIDLALVNHYDPSEFWEPIHSTRRIILNPDDFYILVSKEKVSVPPHLAAEMVAYDPSIGEFRIHYAGFFDPGFGYAVEEGRGTTAVLEVRSHEVPFVVEDGQVVGRLIYERLLEPPEKIYGPKIGSSYQSQGLSLSKQFRRGA
ncbi:MAG: 2'-deoxycytidine 5'-triphosphate deaminase [Acidobacteria bacterium RIFCSPLOWO2_02_FULL_60_20]|nr:MAG: 2'-deoxycytidine 5'-triphosphate deaminase [Acidobacteria bacterium RIFCSPLOWO2_02_FULL_60_20]